MKVLILDDDPFAVKLLALQVQRIGERSTTRFDVIACTTGSQAVARLAADSQAIQLVLCDLQMPEMDGVEFVRRLVGMGYAGALAFVSGEDPKILQAAGQLAEAHDLRVLGVLEKPVPIDRLQQVLDSALQEAAAAPASEAHSYAFDDLRRALDNGELLNHYQPKVDLRTGVVTGVEALVRWRHPLHGMVMPGEFIQLAEECGLITEVGAGVLRTALCDARRWHDAGRPLEVAVNVSMASLQALEFPDELVRSAREAGVPLSLLTLEITETRLMENPRSQLDILTRLRLKHVGLSIDDFGTGYSGLTQLKNLPFGELKIDRGFVHHAARMAGLRAILDASLGLARQLRMKTVAEGVEDEEDWNLLRSTDCQLAQGYFIARPMPCEQIERWLVEWESRRAALTAGSAGAARRGADRSP
jgi:EAL domain-containing protein (putative c-di-GMP-specific phosphodiesterase class I)/CheY-like chemotaxis protein